MTAFARAEVVAYGSFKYDSVNGAGQSDYSLANFRAGFRGKNWSLEGWARNAFDSKYVPIAFQYPGLAPSGYLGESGARGGFPHHRTWRLRLLLNVQFARRH